jgi:hypothetical protein
MFMVEDGSGTFGLRPYIMCDIFFIDLQSLVGVVQYAGVGMERCPCLLPVAGFVVVTTVKRYGRVVEFGPFVVAGIFLNGIVFQSQET